MFNRSPKPLRGLPAPWISPRTMSACCSVTSWPMSRISIAEGRRLFGYDPSSYAAARPDYPAGLYDRLVERCGLRPGMPVFEVGAGTGLATRRLLELGASPLVAIEPDPTLAAFLT